MTIEDSVLDSVEDSKRLNTELHIKMAIIVPEDEISRSSQHLLITTLSNFRYNIIIPKMNLLNTISLSIKDINGTLGLATTHNLRKWYNMAVKTFLDYLLLLAASGFLVPLFAVISLLVKLSSPGPVFYCHERIGRNGKRIRVWKFRSMITNADEILNAVLEDNPEYRKEWEQSHKLSNDPRVTRIGKFLRKSSLDELPQLFNVILGDMSFIGPGQLPTRKPENTGELQLHFSVKPGLSGMWQVSGRSDTDYAERVAFDSITFKTGQSGDLWLIFKTIGVVLTGREHDDYFLKKTALFNGLCHLYNKSFRIPQKTRS